MSNLRLFVYHNSVISYRRYGMGQNLLVAFHGYGQNASDFQYFEEVLSECWTVLAIDFFWHGESQWMESQDFTATDLKDIILGIVTQERLEQKLFSVCSFSMGALLAQTLVQQLPEQIQYLVLISPPTVAFNRFLNITTNTYLGLRLFQYLINHTGRLSNWVKRLHQLRILDRSLYQFASQFVAQPHRMKKVYKTWYSLRKVNIDWTTFVRLLDFYNIQTTLIGGIHDTITPPHRMSKRMSAIKNGRVFLLDQHHQLTTPLMRNTLHKVLNVGIFLV